MDKGLRFIADLIEPLRVAPGSTVKLSRDHDPGYTGQVTRPQATAGSGCTTRSRSGRRRG